jgi:ribonucleoside-diphosphate reductase beta chain
MAQAPEVPRSASSKVIDLLTTIASGQSAGFEEVIQDILSIHLKLDQLREAYEARDAQLRSSLPAPSAPKPEAKPASAFKWDSAEKGRISLHPILHQAIWEFRKKLEGLHWTAQEVDYTRDRRDWDTRMSADEREFVKKQLAFFARIDIDLLGNLDENFGEEVDCLEARMVYAAQKDQECVHAESYSLQIEAVLDGAERTRVLEAVKHMPIIARMREWVLRWCDRERPLGERLVAFTFIEGVLFSGSFCALQWLKSKNLLPGITESNDFISRDEGVHWAFTALLVANYLIARPAQATVEEILADLIKILDVFVEEALPVRLIGMNAELMKQYIRFQADSVLAEMRYRIVYRVQNPFDFMDAMALNEVAKVNFFETKATQYQSVTNSEHARLAIDDSPVDD